MSGLLQKEGLSMSPQEAFEKYRRLVWYILHKDYIRPGLMRNKHLIEDAEQEGYLALWMAVSSHRFNCDPEFYEGNRVAFVSNKIRWVLAAWWATAARSIIRVPKHAADGSKWTS